jgi:uncharacterized protein YlxP (DUF503 family)
MSGRLAMSDSLNDKLDSLQRCVERVRESDEVSAASHRTASMREIESSLASRKAITRPVLDHLRNK